MYVYIIVIHMHINFEEGTEIKALLIHVHTKARLGVLVYSHWLPGVVCHGVLVHASTKAEI